MSKRAASAVKADVPVFDIGRARLVKNTTVFISAGEHGRKFSGSLVGVWERDGVPYAAMVWNGRQVRHVDVERIERWVEPTETDEEAS